MKQTSFYADSLFYTALFIVFFTFYVKAHPIIPFDADDWENLTFFRGAFPSLRQWNPTKIFPECFEPVVGLVAAYIVSPLVGDYLNALVYSNAFVVSSFILLYLYLVQRLLINKFQLSHIISYLIVVLFALFHFLILRTSRSSNEYLWFSHDANCYYHYTISNLLCASLVLWMIRHDLREPFSNLRITLLLVAFYFALCSNLYSSVILISYIGSLLLYELFNYQKGEKWVKKFIIEYKYYLLIIFIWIIIQLLEINGGRAHYSHMQDSFGEYISLSFNYFIGVRYNFLFICFALFVVGGAVLFKVRLHRGKKKRISKLSIQIMMSLILSSLYLILLSSRVDPLYLTQGQVIFSYAFFLLLLLLTLLVFLIRNIRLFQFALPFFIIIAFFEVNTSKNTFRDIQYEYTDNPRLCMDFNRNMLYRAKKAEIECKDSISCIVPNFGCWDNWPITHKMSCAGLVLRKHGILHKDINIIMRRDRSMPLHQLSEPFFIIDAERE